MREPGAEFGEEEGKVKLGGSTQLDGGRDIEDGCGANQLGELEQRLRFVGFAQHRNDGVFWVVGIVHLNPVLQDLTFPARRIAGSEKTIVRIELNLDEDFHLPKILCRRSDLKIVDDALFDRSGGFRIEKVGKLQELFCHLHLAGNLDDAQVAVDYGVFHQNVLSAVDFDFIQKAVVPLDRYGENNIHDRTPQKPVASEEIGTMRGGRVVRLAGTSPDLKLLTKI